MIFRYIVTVTEHCKKKKSRSSSDARLDLRSGYIKIFHRSSPHFSGIIENVRSCYYGRGRFFQWSVVTLFVVARWQKLKMYYLFPIPSNTVAPFSVSVLALPQTAEHVFFICTLSYVHFSSRVINHFKNYLIVLHFCRYFADQNAID